MSLIRGFAILVSGIALTTSAFAADLEPAAAPYDWSGVYGGINGGVGFGQNTWNEDTLSLTSGLGTFSGLAGGLTLGDNFQSGNLVYGFELDGDLSNIEASGVGGTMGCGAPGCHTKVSWLGTARGRVGVLATDNVLLYATAGIAAGGVNLFAPISPLAQASGTHIGWTVGAGIEAALNDSWSAKLEGLYVNLGRQEEPNACAVHCYSDVSFGLARLGLNYKF
jgi:outer membrane immunogenic protein